jgi:outer membrane immunogenic protein
MRKLAIWSAALAGLAGPALAADLPQRAPLLPLPPAPAFTWVGFYVGTHTALIGVEGTIRTYGNAPNTLAEIAAAQRPASLSIDDANC